jgi:hypothetical protein
MQLAHDHDNRKVPILLRLLCYLRRNVIVCVALFFFFAVIAGGGYAFAASSTDRVHGCVGKRTHVLYIQARCLRGQRPLVLNQDGQAPLPAWASVLADGFLGAGARGISVQHVGVGTYDLTAAPSQCTQVASAPQVTVDDGGPQFQAPGAFPVAWEAHSGARNSFTVYTGVVVGGNFVPADKAFNVEVPC